MDRRLTCAVALLVAASVAAVPAQAATKKKPKPIKGSYSVQLPPDPTANFSEEVGATGCAGVIPISQDQHEFKVPAKGTLKVHLSATDPTGAGQLDWDLSLLDADGDVISDSLSAGSEEETFNKLKKKQTVFFQACNLAGLPDATVTYVFTYA